MKNQKTLITRRLELVIIICIVASVAAIISHGIIAWLQIETTIGRHWVIDRGVDKPSGFVAGSSLSGDGLSWVRISEVVNVRMEGWGIAGSSPSEWECFQYQAKETKLSFIVVSVYDLNEYFLSDFRAEVVSLGQTIKDLWHTGADSRLWKRLLSQYPLSYVRILFPTAGRSAGVMDGGREKIKKLVSAVSPIESEAGPTLSFNGSVPTQAYKKEKISNWDPGRMLRRLASMRSACQGIHAFSGPKRLAFLRMLRLAEEQGRVVVVVLPVSPAYAREFVSSEVKREFEEVLAEVQRNVPQARWIRLDQLTELNSNEYFWDLVHLNIYGKDIATDAFLGQLTGSPSLP